MCASFSHSNSNHVLRTYVNEPQIFVFVFVFFVELVSFFFPLSLRNDRRPVEPRVLAGEHGAAKDTVPPGVQEQVCHSDVALHQLPERGLGRMGTRRGRGRLDTRG